jgi:hypothetical protein
VRELGHQYGLINDSPKPLKPPVGELPADTTAAAPSEAAGVAVARAPVPAKANGHPDIQPMPAKPAALVAAAPAARVAPAPAKAAPARVVGRRRAGAGVAARRARRLALARAAAEADAAIAAAAAPVSKPAAKAAAPAAAPAPAAKPKAEPAEAPAPQSEAVKKAANSGDELDELMASAVGPSKRGSDLDKKLATVQKGDAAPAKAAAAPAATKAQPLSRSDIETAMSSVKAEMADCYAKTGKGGPVDLKISVSPEGDVKNTVIKGEFAGTPTGACVEKKVKATVFPASAGLNFDYRLVVK